MVDAQLYQGQEFYDLVNQANSSRRSELAHLLMGVCSKIDMGVSTCFAVTGSDGKNERNTHSKTEVVILRRPDEPPIRKSLSRLLDAKRNHIDTASDGKLAEYTVPEYGNSSADVPLSFVHGDKNVIYPDFLLNSTVLNTGASTQIHRDTRKHVLDEMSGDGPHGRRIRDAMKNQLRNYKKGIGGVYNHEVCFDNEAVYYDEGGGLFNRRKNFGVKAPFLRAVQRKLDISTMEVVRAKPYIIDEIGDNLSPQTPKRLAFLNEQSYIGSYEAGDVSAAYIYFLRLQHQSQYLYDQSKRLVRVPFEQTEFSRHKKVIAKFVDYAEDV
jgi:hypothetical protein